MGGEITERMKSYVLQILVSTQCCDPSELDIVISARATLSNSWWYLVFRSIEGVSKIIPRTFANLDQDSLKTNQSDLRSIPVDVGMYEDCWSCDINSGAHALSRVKISSAVNRVSVNGRYHTTDAVAE